MTRRFDDHPSPLIAHLQCAIELSDREVAVLSSLTTDGGKTAAKGEILQKEGEPHEAVYIVNAGWAIRHKDLPDGRRQVLDFVLPGDVVSVEGSVARRADHTVSALTDLAMSQFPFARIEDLIQHYPKLVAALVWSGARQRAIFAEHIVSLGRRTAYERLAHLLLEVWRRLRVRGLGGDQTFQMPVTQAVLADTLGLSIVHVNRSLRQLTRDGLVEKHRNTVKIIDLQALIDAAGFDEGYLGDAPMPDEMLTALERLRTKPAVATDA